MGTHLRARQRPVDELPGRLHPLRLLAAEDRHCSTGWYNNYWGYYWGRWWRFGPVGRVNVGNTGCGYWRTTLAFSFMASMAHLLSLILGIYIFREYVRVKDTVATAKKQAGKLRKSHSATHLENGHNGATSTRPGLLGRIIRQCRRSLETLLSR